MYNLFSKANMVHQKRQYETARKMNYPIARQRKEEAIKTFPQADEGNSC